jgi:hypothetical protein
MASRRKRLSFKQRHPLTPTSPQTLGQALFFHACGLLPENWSMCCESLEPLVAAKGLSHEHETAEPNRCDPWQSNPKIAIWS